MSDKPALALGDILGALEAEQAPRPNWCPGALIREPGGKERRLPCDRDVLTGTARCGPCTSVEANHRQQLLERCAKPSSKATRRNGYDR